jgi:hypothetical protein
VKQKVKVQPQMLDARLKALEFRQAISEALVANYVGEFDPYDDRVPRSAAARIAQMVVEHRIAIDFDVGANAPPVEAPGLSRLRKEEE